MKKVVALFFFLLIALCFLYFIGPRTSAPKLQVEKINLPNSLVELEQHINSQEKATKGLKPDNQARIVWADSTKKEKTKTAILYLHGFTASQADGAPIHVNIAKKLNANLYLFRNEHHGVDLGNETMINANADDFYQASENALAITKRLGDEVIIMGTSLGGTLTLYLASKHPDLKGIVLYAPGIRPKQSNANLLLGPWGFQLTKLLAGSSYIDIKEVNPLNRQYWSTRFHLNGVIAALNFIKNTMQETTFRKIKCPTLVCYWYKNEQIQDTEVSVASMRKMYEQLGTPAELKQEIAFPDANNHVIGSFITSKSYKEVEKETMTFLSKLIE